MGQNGFQKCWHHSTHLTPDSFLGLQFFLLAKKTREEEKGGEVFLAAVNQSKAHCLKITQNVLFEFSILAFSTNFCPINIDLSGNTVWPQALRFWKLAKLSIFAAPNVEWDFFSDFQTPCVGRNFTSFVTFFQAQEVMKKRF